MNIRRLLTSFLLSLWISTFAAPQIDLMFRHYTTDDGLASNCIRDIIQDQDGFVWLATDGGLLRFDGRNFRTYLLKCPVEGHGENNFASALLNADGKMYVGTDSHLYVYNRDQDVFDYVPLSSKTGATLTPNIRNMVADRDGNMWLSTFGHGALRLRWLDDGECQVDALDITTQRGYVGHIFVDSRNDIWAVTNSGEHGVYRFDKAKNAFLPFRLASNGVEVHPMASVITEDNSGRMWVGTWEGHLLGFDPYTGQCDRLNLPLGSVQHVHTLLPVAPDVLMVGSDIGLLTVDTRTGAYTLYAPDELNTTSLSGKFIYPIMIDAEGGLWIGTYYSGVNYAPPMLKMFERYRTSHYLGNSVSGYVISAFAEDSNGNIYIASDDGGLSRYNPASGTFSKVPINNADNLHALAFADGRLFVGSYGAGVYCLDCATGRASKVEAPESDFENISSYALLHDSKHRMWVAMNDGLTLYDAATNALKLVKPLGAQISHIAESPTGEIWVATQGDGLHVLAGDGSWRHYTAGSSEAARASASLPHDHVSSTVFSSTGDVWIATTGGLCRFDQPSGQFVIEPEALDGIEIISMVEDQGILWLTTTQGLLKYTPGSVSGQNSQDNIEVFTMSDGLCSSQFMSNAIFKTSGGKIYVGTRSGFNAFYPYQIKPNAAIPPVVFTGLEINNQPVALGDSHLLGNLNGLDRLVLHPGDDSFGVSFAALSYVNPDKNHYAYRLVGFDKDWIEADGINKALYTNLPAGDYTLEIRGSNNDNVWNPDPTSLHIRVLPPWYMSWYMKVLYALLIASLIAGVIWLLMRRANRKHTEDMARMKNRKETELYESKLQFFTMVAHEIRTPVTLILAPLEKLMRQMSGLPNSAALNLSMIESNCQRLLFLVNQLLDFKKSEETGLAVSFRSCNIPDLVNSVIDRFRPTLEQKHIAIDVDFEVGTDFCADVDPEALTKLVSNLVNNARKFTKDQISIRVGADEAKGVFFINVADNGCGIDKAEQRKIFRPFYQVASDDNTMRGGTGLGLSIVQGVVEAHKGSVALDSELGQGTVFTVRLPIHQSDVVAADPIDTNTAEPVVAPVAQASAELPVMLVVDDNEELCNFIANNFSEKYKVLTAENGVEALDVMRHNEVALVVSDWMMPRMDGVEFCQTVRADMALSHIPFILLTAKTDDMSKVLGLNCGADAYIEKPFSVQLLEARIDNLLSIRSMLRQKYSQTPLEPIESVAQHPADNEFLSQLTRIIEDNFANADLDVDFLAARMDMSRSSLYAKIHSLVDVTPNDLIRITRLKQAAKLLSTGNYRINEVCYMVGFNSSSYFTKCFQKQFGMTPSEFISSGSPISANPAN